MQKKTGLIFWGISFFVLILDSAGAAQYALEGIQLCIKTVIPSLFPLLIVTGAICEQLISYKLPFIRKIDKVLGLPEGAEKIFILGLLGGYPMGAKLINQSFQSGILNKSDANRMMGFCNNPGPAFLFGIAGTLFNALWVPWCIWGIQIISAVMVGLLLPFKSVYSCRVSTAKVRSFPEILTDGIKAMATICGWIVLFRVLIGFVEQGLLRYLQKTTGVFLIGIIELTNGLHSLKMIDAEKIRFVLACLFLSCGGLCVAMQTVSVTKDCGMGFYWIGKIMQVLVSLCLALITAPFLFQCSLEPFYLLFAFVLAVFLWVICIQVKKI